MTENEMVRRSYEILEKRAVLELPINACSCDMVIFDNDEIHAVEFKLHNWRRAIQQANRHRMAVDYCWICIPQISKTGLEYAKLNQVGVYKWDDGNLMALLDAPKTQSWEAERQRAIKMFKKFELRGEVTQCAPSK